MKPRRYLALTDAAQGGLNVQLPDVAFPKLHAKIPYYELVNDVPQPVADGTLAQRFRNNHLAPNPMYTSEETAAKAVVFRRKLKDGQFDGTDPSQPVIKHRTYHILVITLETNEYEYDLGKEIEAMVNAYDQAAGITTHRPLGELLRQDQYEAFFTEPDPV